MYHHNPMSKLQLSVKKKYFDEIKAGIKPFEFRLRTDYWYKRLVDRNYDTLIFTLGYPKKEDINRRLIMAYHGYEEQTIVHPFFSDQPVDVFAIRIVLDNKFAD